MTTTTTDKTTTATTTATTTTATTAICADFGTAVANFQKSYAKSEQAKADMLANALHFAWLHAKSGNFATLATALRGRIELKGGVMASFLPHGTAGKLSAYLADMGVVLTGTKVSNVADCQDVWDSKPPTVALLAGLELAKTVKTNADRAQAIKGNTVKLMDKMNATERAVFARQMYAVIQHELPPVGSVMANSVAQPQTVQVAESGATAQATPAPAPDSATLLATLQKQAMDLHSQLAQPAQA